MSFVPTFHVTIDFNWIVSEMKYICNFGELLKNEAKWNESGNFCPFVTLNESIRKFEIDIKYVFIQYTYRFSTLLCTHINTEHRSARTILNGNEVSSLVILLKHLRSEIFYFELIVYPMEKQNMDRNFAKIVNFIPGCLRNEVINDKCYNQCVFLFIDSIFNKILIELKIFARTIKIYI